MISISELAKYPFLPEAADHVRELGVKIDELDSPLYEKVLERAEERILEALAPQSIDEKYVDDRVELLSFPVALMMLSWMRNDLLNRRFAVKEAKRAYERLRLEPTEKLKQYSLAFEWDAQTSNLKEEELLLSFPDYLKASSKIKESHWKLVNRPVIRGYVYLGKVDFARLMQEEIASTIHRKIAALSPVLTKSLEERVKELSKRVEETLKPLSETPAPGRLTLSMIPPCVKSLYDAVTAGRNISHIERFTLTTFLVKMGLKLEDLLGLFKPLPDFDEEKARYQIEHIMGVRGSRRKYAPPACKTLKTHGLCRNPDETCLKITHPLGYYRRKVGKLRGG
ncbi:MAG: DNA primase large subunit PriL [Candidatus Bathyarchaeia archaeon]